MNRIPRTAAALSLALAILPVGGCDLLEREVPEPPTAAEARTFYEEYPGLNDVRVSGNVVVLRAEQSGAHLRQGGSIWARVGPYIYLFSPSTRDLFQAERGVAAVRAVTIGPAGEEVARAMLARDTLTSVEWRRSINLLGHAVTEGTDHPARLEDLIFWGERFAEHWYSPQYVEGNR